MRKLVHSYFEDDTAATSIEYAMIASMVSIFIVVVVIQLGSQLNVVFYEKIASALK